MIYQACGVDDGLECFGHKTKILYKISIFLTLLMNLMVFQDYLAKFMKKWKGRRAVEPAILSNISNNLNRDGSNVQINLDSNKKLSKENQIIHTMPDCVPTPSCVELPKIENHIRYSICFCKSINKAYFIVFLLALWDFYLGQ